MSFGPEYWSKKDRIMAKLVVVGLIAFAIGFVVFVFDSLMDANKCLKDGCNRQRTSGSVYCSQHTERKPRYSGSKSNSGSSSKTPYRGRKSSSGNSYNATHSTRKSSSSGYSGSSSTKRNYNSYDEGYDSIYMDDDYDYNRYYSDDDYASGVDDAMEDAWEDYGDDW